MTAVQNARYLLLVVMVISVLLNAWLLSTLNGTASTTTTTTTTTNSHDWKSFCPPLPLLLQPSTTQNHHNENGRSNTDSDATTTTITKTTTKRTNRTVFFHIHLMKTAGTEINGELAAHFNGVCGHKGYSYDYYQYNQRVKEIIEANGKNVTNGIGIYHTGAANGGPKNTAASRAAFQDSYAALKGNSFSRGRIPWSIMNEIGYENCDYISHEVGWQFWPKQLNSWPIQPDNIVVHVPCRNPIDHLLSQCNYWGKQFTCPTNRTSFRNDTEYEEYLLEQIRPCLQMTTRFQYELMKELPNRTQFQCFQPIPVQPYIDYMSQFLQRKWIETNYIHRDTNFPRKKKQECLLQPSSSTLRHDVTQLLYQHWDDFHFCHDCMGSSNEIQLT